MKETDLIRVETRVKKMKVWGSWTNTVQIFLLFSVRLKPKKKKKKLMAVLGFHQIGIRICVETNGNLENNKRWIKLRLHAFSTRVSNPRSGYALGTLHKLTEQGRNNSIEFIYHSKSIIINWSSEDINMNLYRAEITNYKNMFTWE